MPRLRPIWTCVAAFLLLAFGPSTGRADDIGARLLRAYPQALAAVEGNQLIGRDGTRMALDDDIHGKDFKALLDRPDIEDQFAYRYSMGRDYPIPARNQDPGRIRNAAFFRNRHRHRRQHRKRRLLAWDRQAGRLARYRLIATVFRSKSWTSSSATASSGGQMV